MQKFFKKKIEEEYFNLNQVLHVQTHKNEANKFFSLLSVYQLALFLRFLLFFFHFNEEWLKCHYPLLHDFAAY